MKGSEPRSYTFKNTWTVRERNLPEKGSAPLYCIAFNLSHPRHQHIFATAGGTRASVYECKEDGRFELMQVYHDPNATAACLHTRRAVVSRHQAASTQALWACSGSCSSCVNQCTAAAEDSSVDPDEVSGALLLVFTQLDTQLCFTGGRNAADAKASEGSPACPSSSTRSPSTSALQEGEELFTCQWTQDEVSGAPLLLLAGKLGCLSVINCTTKQLEWQGLGHGDAINDISVDPGRPCIVVTASRDRTLRLWNIRTRVCISILGGEGGHRNEVLSIDFHPFDSNKVLSASLDHSVKIWDLQSVRKYIEESHNYNDASAQEAFPTVRLQFPHFTSRKVHNAYVDCVRWMGDIVLSKSVHNVIFMWEPDCTSTDTLQQGFIHLLHELPLREAHAWFIRFALNPACSVLACGAVDGHVRIWAPQDGSSEPRRIVRCTSANPSQNMTVRQTAVSFDGNTVLACCEDASIWRFEAMPDARKAT